MQHPVPNELLSHIGDVTVSFALLEVQLQSVIGFLIGDQQRIGQLLCSYLPFKNLRAACKALYLERFGEDDDFEVLKGLIREAAEIEEERNRITHSFWGVGEREGSITRIKITAFEKKGLRFDFEQYDSEVLEGFANKIKELGANFQRFYITLLEKTRPSA